MNVKVGKMGRKRRRAELASGEKFPSVGEMKMQGKVWRIGVALGMIALGMHALWGGERPSDLLKSPGAEREAGEPAPVAAQGAAESEGAGELVTPQAARSAGGIAKVYRVPIEGAISKPNLFILRRSVKQAISAGVDAIVLDMDTPGGRLDITLEMMEILSRFEGQTLTYVNKDAISAGAYISMATDAIYFAPNGVMGAAAVVSGGGQEIDESMKAKIYSYLLARMRSYTEAHPYRADVIRAMADIDFELTIDGQVIKSAGELLSLTAQEAVRTYGVPPRPLLAEGVAASIEALLDRRYGAGGYEVLAFEVTWSEEVAKFMDSIAPILLGLGFLALFVEFKTPGFGVFGVGGLALVAIVFLSNYVAGLAGWEGLLLFILGLVFIIIDIFLLPGTFVFLIAGLVLVLGSLIWSLADFWPTPGGGDGNGGPGFGFEVDPANLWLALYEVLGGLGIALIGLILVWRFLPKTPLYGRLVHQYAGAAPDPVVAGGGHAGTGKGLPDLGSHGVVSKVLHPIGEVEVDGQRYEATCSVGILEKGTAITVTGYRAFALQVEKREDAQ